MALSTRQYGNDVRAAVTVAEPQFRIRIAYTRTQKNGWGSEQTVEVSAGDVHELRALLEGLSREADSIGRHECMMRNAQDAQEEAHRG